MERSSFAIFASSRLPQGNGLAAWYAAAPVTGPRNGLRPIAQPRTIVGRRRHHIERRGLVGHWIAEEQEILADLTGPGAVTQIWRSQFEGKLAFYLDGQSKPAIECRPDQLPGRLPDLFVEQKIRSSPVYPMPKT